MLQLHNNNAINYIYAASVLILLVFMIQYDLRYISPEDSMILKIIRPRTEINFVTEFPDIKPEKCLKTSPFIGGN